MLLHGHGAWAPRCSVPQQQHLSNVRPHMRALRTHRRGLVQPCTASSNGKGGEFSDKGNLEVQDELVDQIQIGIAKAKVKEDLLKDLEQRKDGLRKIGDELTDQLEKRLELDKARMNLAGNASLADTLEEFRQLDEDVQRIRDELQADRRDLVAFEKRKAEERSKGLFFKRLYTVKDEEEEQEGGSSGKSRQEIDAEAAEKRKLAMDRVKEPARQELRSPLRLGLFAYLTIVLAWVVAQDISLGDPDWRRDALYGVLCLILGINTWNERQTLVQEREAVSKLEEQVQQQQQQQQEQQEVQGEDGKGEGGGNEKQ